MTDRVGQQFGNYRLVALLGRGGYAEVYLGQHLRLSLQAAIKVLHTHLTDTEAAHFQQEAETIARLTHPSIVRVLDFDVQDGVPFLVMDYATHGSLRLRHPAGEVVSLTQIGSYVRQVATALQYAHEHKVVHRDVKPENILLGKNDELLLSDFGIAVIVHSTNSLGRPNVGGTLPYMAPEQLAGRPRAASDQYALGIIAYEWLCGTRPFRGTQTEIISQHLSTPPPPFKKELCILPAIEDVVQKALAKDPEQRFENVEAFAIALERASKLSTLPPNLISQGNRVVSHEQGSSPTPSGSFEQLWRDAVRAQARGEIERAFRLLRKIMTMQGLTSSQVESVKTQIRTFRQMIPLCLQQAQEANVQGRWQDEIQAWKDLLVLEPSEQEITEPVILSQLRSYNGQWTIGHSPGNIQQRLDIARQNEQCAWMYTLAQRFIREQDGAAARTQLQTLWNHVPYYGDPLGLAQMVGLPPARNYEQALTEEQARQQREREEAERERQKQQQREEAERERQKQRQREADELARQDKRRRAIAARLRGIAAGISGGTGVGCLAGVLLAGIWYTFAPPQRILEQEFLGHSLVSVLERVFIFFAISPEWVSVIIAGVLAGLTVGAVVGCIRSIINPSCYSSGTIAGGIVGFFAGLVVLGIAGSLIGGIIGAALCVAFGPWLGMRVGAEMGASIGGKWEYRYRYYR